MDTNFQKCRSTKQSNPPEDSVPSVISDRDHTSAREKRREGSERAIRVPDESVTSLNRS